MQRSSDVHRAHRPRRPCGRSGREVLAALGVPEDDGALVADSLVQADLWGHQSHGFLRLPWYAARLRSGAMAARHRPRGAVRHRSPPAARRPRRHRPGADRASPCAGGRARPPATASASSACATPTISARPCTSPAGPPHDGCVAVLTTNASPAMAPWGGREKRARHQPVVDRRPRRRTAGSSRWTSRTPRWHAARSTWRRTAGEPIPETWALTADGAPTTDRRRGCSA